MIRTDKRLRLCSTLIVLILVFIWGNSLLSAEISHAFSQWFKGLLTPLLPEDSAVTQEGSGLVRKMAHFAEFAALGFCLGWRSGMLGRKLRWAFLSGAAAAAIDETIQCFVPDRGPSVRDVLLDSSGVLTGMLLLILGHTLLKKRKTNTLLEDTK